MTTPPRNTPAKPGNSPSDNSASGANQSQSSERRGSSGKLVITRLTRREAARQIAAFEDGDSG